jgi:threonine dehydratase
MLPSFDTICSAAQTINGHATQTPLLESPALNKKLGGRLFVKAEMLQKTGSFKFRGAFNALSQLNDEQRAKGVFAYSSGNHAQGVALAAAMKGVKATILMPEDTPQIKLENTKGYGATVVTYDRYKESREEIGAEIAEKGGLSLIKPYDNPQVISGQGTVGLEVTQQLEDLGLEIDLIAAPCGGGGLLSGISLVIQEKAPKAQIYAAEPEYFDDTTRSLKLGERVQNSNEHRSICDAIMTPMPGEITFPILQQNGVEGLVVNEDEVRLAMWVAFHYFKVVVEPGGAVALAALITGKTNITDKIAVAVTSGGNVDQNLFTKILASDISF